MKEKIVYRHPQKLPATSGTMMSKPIGIRLTLRDIEILEALYSARYLTTPQIQKLFWGHLVGSIGPVKACQRRLRKLTQTDLIRQIEQPVKRSEPSKPYLYTIAKKGAQILASELGVAISEIEYKPAPLEENYPFLDHLLATTDLRIAVMHACGRNSFELVEWIDEKELRSVELKDYVMIKSADGRKIRSAVVPDAYFAIGSGSKSMRFLVEVDQGTVTIRAKWSRGWTRKILTYCAYFVSEPYQKRFGSKRARLLTITTTKKRLANMLEATAEVDGSDSGLFWFTTMEEATDPDKLLTAKIWHVVGRQGLFALLG